TRQKHSERFNKSKELALVLFVAIPFPVTGAWTGSLCAFLFDIPFARALPLIFLGVVIAGVIVALLSLGIINFNNFVL
ncbi:MAG: small multi-drug export protein, partial [Candidatus Pacebacteria bacterium]|nr:small multi-drug export protein [Candidatus Paceibacterota bacterium]